MENRFLVIEEICRRYAVSKSNIYKMIREGNFPPQVKIGRKARWSIDRLLEWEHDLEKQQVNGPSAGPSYAA